MTCYYCGQPIDKYSEVITTEKGYVVHEECASLGAAYWQEEAKRWREFNGVRWG